MDPFDESDVAGVCLRQFRSAVFKAVADVHLGEVPSVTEYNELLDGIFRDIVNGVQPYSINNVDTVHQMTQNNPVKVIGYSVEYVGAYGIDLGPQHLPTKLARARGYVGPLASTELKRDKKITPAALARALCSRGGRSVCDGKGCTQGTKLGHELNILTYQEAQALNMDYTIPVIVGFKQHVFQTAPDATDDEVNEAAQAIFDATGYAADERGCFVFSSVSNGELSSARGGPMVCVESDTTYRFVSRMDVIRPVGSRGCIGDPRDGQFILAGARKTIRRLVRGATSQIQVRGEPSSTDPHGHKASMRRHAADGDAMVVDTFYITDTSMHGGSKKLKLLRHDLSRQKKKSKTERPKLLKEAEPSHDRNYGMWVGATWMTHALPLALLYMALGVLDDRTILPLCGFYATDVQVQRDAIIKTIQEARGLLESADWIPDVYTTAQGEVHRVGPADRARIFFVEQAARLNQHQHFGTGHNRRFDAMIQHFYDVVVPKMIDGIDGYNSLARLATLQWMATRVVLCTRDKMAGTQGLEESFTNRPSDPNHWGEMRVYGVRAFIGQEMRKALRRSLGTRMGELRKTMVDSGWDTHNIQHAFKLGDGSNSMRKFIVQNVLEVERTQIKGLSVVSADSPLQAFSDQYILYKEKKEQVPAGIRDLHTTGYGHVSPNEISEGHSVGLVNRQAAGATVTPIPPADVDQVLFGTLSRCPGFQRFVDLLPVERSLGPSRAEYRETRPPDLEAVVALGQPGMVRVVKDGMVVGAAKDVNEVIRHVRAARRKNKKLRYVSVAYYHGAVVIQTTRGRMGRWMVVIDDNGKIALPLIYRRLLLGSFADLSYLTLERLLECGVLEFVSAMEAESVKIVHTKPELIPVVPFNGEMVEDPGWIHEWKEAEKDKMMARLTEIDAEFVRIGEEKLMWDERRQVIKNVEAVLPNLTNPAEIDRARKSLVGMRKAMRGMEDFDKTLGKLHQERNKINTNLIRVSSREPARIKAYPDMGIRMVTDGKYVCAVLMDTHMDPHEELLLGAAAGVTGFTGFNKSPREAIQTIHTTHAISQPPQDMLHGYRFSTRMTRDIVDKDLTCTKMSGYAPTPGRTIKLVAIISEGAWLSEDAQGANHRSNQMDERRTMCKTIQICRVVDARMPMPLTDDYHGTRPHVIACFPGQDGEAEMVRTLQRTRQDPGQFAGFMSHEITPDGQVVFHDDLIECPGLQRNEKINYATLDADGLPAPGTVLHPVTDEGVSQAVMGLVMVQAVEEVGPDEKNEYDVWYRDMTITWDQPMPGVVQNVIVAGRPDGKIAIKVNVIIFKKGETLGDKFSLPMGQKGVNSILHHVADEYTIYHTDPFFSGLVVERTFGPHGYSRMTKSLFLQMAINWLALKRGHYTRGTFGEAKYTDADLERLRKELRREGINPRCAFNLINPATGKRIPNIFCGYVAVQAQPHWADFKCRGKARGKRHFMTRQPMVGDSFRVGEMERDAFLAHGAACVMRERMFWSSDAYRIHVCEKCGHFAVANPKLSIFTCSGCKDKAEICQINMPYAAKLMWQELMAFGIGMKLKFDENIAPTPPMDLSYSGSVWDKFVVEDEKGKEEAPGQLPAEVFAGTEIVAEPFKDTSNQREVELDLRLGFEEQMQIVNEALGRNPDDEEFARLVRARDELKYESSLMDTLQ